MEWCFLIAGQTEGDGMVPHMYMTRRYNFREGKLYYEKYKNIHGSYINRFFTD